MEDAPKTPIHPQNTDLGPKTPPQNQRIGQKSQNTTPDRLKVPKAFKYPERYRSPTDLMVSPISKGLLARTRKPGILLPPTIVQPNIQDMSSQEVGLSQT
ncbi:uncharacterized protein LOC130768732 isoform X2 [Actinidia eriantha]|uniref:uncharacterized protein LOC130768732 isoform X2 n=1 Tax=Actinidia eriantha TaxID=165200 RepID=UPI00258B6B66|nr:uncharacterized protein LOC130768732 isoform X2 [Actinidia eriantha]